MCVCVCVCEAFELNIIIFITNSGCLLSINIELVLSNQVIAFHNE